MTAVISLLHVVSEMLTTNQFVRVIALDFSKALDTVKHEKLLYKLSLLDIPNEVYSCVRDCFASRSHSTSFNVQCQDSLEFLPLFFKARE